MFRALEYCIEHKGEEMLAIHGVKIDNIKVKQLNKMFPDL